MARSPARRQMVDDLSNLLLGDNSSDAGSARVAVLTDACAYYERIGRSYDGIARGEAALELAAKIGEKNLERRASNVLSTVYLDTAHFDLGCERLQRAFSIAQELRDPFLECAAMGNTVVLLRTMGLYRDALVVANQVMNYKITTPLGQHVRFLTAATALFCAHRLRDEAAALQFLRIASELVDNPAIDPVARMGFEHSRVVYLLSTRDFETADLLVDNVKRLYGTSTHPRTEGPAQHPDRTGRLCQRGNRTDRSGSPSIARDLSLQQTDTPLSRRCAARSGDGTWTVQR